MAIKSFNVKNGLSVGTASTAVVDPAGAWVGAPIEVLKGGVPAGGTPGQVLTKRTENDRDLQWATLINIVDPPLGPTYPAVHPSIAVDGNYFYFTVADSVWLRTTGSTWTAGTDSSSYRRPDGTFLILRSDGLSAFIRPTYPVFIRPDGVSEYLRVDGISEFVRN